MLNNLGSTVGLIAWRDIEDMASGYFDMSNYPAGIYLLQIVAASGIMEAKVIKQ